MGYSFFSGSSAERILLIRHERLRSKEKTSGTATLLYSENILIDRTEWSTKKHITLLSLQMLCNSEVKYSKVPNSGYPLRTLVDKATMFSVFR
jgi:hypothetical protein